MSKPRITIIGLGQVGTALMRALCEQEYEIESVFNRTKLPHSFLEDNSETEFYIGFPIKGEAIGDLIFLTVSDDAITEVVTEIASHFDSLDQKVFAHCSGTYSSHVLEPLKQKGAHVASFHPIKAITRSTQNFSGTWFDVDGDDEALLLLEEITEGLGGNVIRVKPEAKPLLHASAVVASNYLVVLAGMVSKIADEAGISEEIALKAITPLMESTLENIQEMGVTGALTGPIERGDVNTIAEHITILNATPEILSLYKALGKEAAEIAEKKKGVTESLSDIKKLFS